MIHYILQIVAFQLVFLLIYDAFLKRETFFNINRLYLLVTSLLSVVLPFIKIETIRETVAEDFVIVLPEVIIGKLEPVSNVDLLLQEQAGLSVMEPTTPIWQILLIAGMVLALTIFLYKIIKIYILRHTNPKRWNGNILLVHVLKSTSAFSFFNTVFLGEQISDKEKPTILKHELVHVKQLHSIDLLWFELLRIALWFNPLVYMYQNRIQELHEFIADQHSVKENGKKEYYNQLLNQVFETQNISFTNTFFKSSLIKKRIAMLQKAKSKHAALAKYALLIPVVFGMLIYTSAEVKAQEPTKAQTTTEVVEIQEISDEELKQKYYSILEKMFQEKIPISEITAFAFPKGNRQKYKMSKEEYYGMSAFIKLMNTQYQELIKTKDEIVEVDYKARKSIMEMADRSYDEYLEWLNTSEAKKSWENGAKDGVLRLFVEDLKNLTVQEKKRQEEKLNLIEKDNYWNALLISDGGSSTKMIVHEIDGNKIQDYINNDAVSSKNIIETVEVPFGVIENVPTYPECKESATNADKKKCTSQAIAKFVNKRFNTKLATELGLEGRQRISVMFKIDKQGKVTDIRARAPHPELEKEAKRVIGKLPKFNPGTQKGEPVVVPYSLPILFQVASNKESTTPEFDKFETKIKQNQQAYPYTKVDKVPVLKECENLSGQDEQKKCTSQEVAKFVNKNFNLDMASKLGLVGRQRISVLFTFGADGTIKDIKAHAQHLELEKESIRVISLLPEFIPGQKDGKNVNVNYSLPIVFQIQGKANTKKEFGEIKNFKISIERTEDGIKMMGLKGTAWTNLAFTIDDFQPQAIDEYGMTSVNNTSTKTDDKFADFSFTITKTDDLIFLKGLKGTAWTELKFSLGKDDIQIINQKGTE